MAKQRRDLKHRLASLLELPGDVVMDVPRLTMVGDLELLVENHSGLLGFAEERVVVGTPRGPLSIYGESLSIAMLSPDHVQIRGRIRALQYHD